MKIKKQQWWHKKLEKTKFISNISKIIEAEDLTTGDYTSKYEKNICKFLRVKYSIAVSSGTAALEIAVKALGIKKNDEVLIPNFTIISNALAVVRQQAKPVLLECDINNWNIDCFIIDMV